MTTANPAETLARRFLWLALFGSLAGFLGFYDAQGFVTPPPFIVLALQLIATGGAVLVFRDGLLRNIRGVLPLMLVAAWAALTLVWADDPATALRRWMLVFVPGILICLLAARDSRPQQTFVWFTGVVLVITISSAAFSAIVWIFANVETGGVTSLSYLLIDLEGRMIGMAKGGRQYHFEDFRLYIHRFSGLTSNPNSAGLFAAIALISLCALIKPRLNARGIALCLVACLVAILILASASRAAIAMAVTGMFVVFLLRNGRPGTTRVCVVLVIGLALLLYGVTWFAGEPPKPGGAEIIELRERAQVWRIAIQIIGDVWPSGLGFGLTQESVYAPRGLMTAAHSVTLSVLVETGIVGLVLTLAAWFYPVFAVTRRGQTISPTSIAVVSLLIALFVHQTVDSSVFRYHWAHFVFVYLLGVNAGLAGSRTNA